MDRLSDRRASDLRAGDLETKREVIQTFSEKLRGGGYLLLGHSESLINVSSAFELAHLRNDLVYRRPIAGETRWDTWQMAAQAAIGKSDPVERTG